MASFRGRPAVGRPRTRPSELHFHALHLKPRITSFAPNPHHGRRRSAGPARRHQAKNLTAGRLHHGVAGRPSMRPGGARPRPVGARPQSPQPPFNIKEVGPSCAICPTSPAAACVDGAAILACCSPPRHGGGTQQASDRWVGYITLWRRLGNRGRHKGLNAAGRHGG